MWLLPPPQSRRPWAVFTWLATVPAPGVVALVQVRGIGDSDPHRLIQPQPQWYRHAVLGPLDEYGKPDFDPEIDELYKDLPEFVEAYEHGWPMPWLHRALGYGSGRWRAMSFT